jgi:hypothetical protein
MRLFSKANLEPKRNPKEHPSGQGASGDQPLAGVRRASPMRAGAPLAV